MSLIERAAAKQAQEGKRKARNRTARPVEKDVAATIGPVENHDSLIEQAGAKAEGGIKEPKQAAKPVEAPVVQIEAEAPPRQIVETAQQTIPVERNRVSNVGKSSNRYGELDLAMLREAGYITPDMPPSLMSEELRLVKRTVLLNAFTRSGERLNDGNLVLVTSSNPGEGKTFFSINLALSIASEQDVTVLLVDADFSKPEILNRLGVTAGKGLLDVVADKSLDIGDCLVRTNVPNLVLLPAGQQHHLATELLASERMETIVREIGDRYPDRIIVFDSPPVLASSAASVLALYMGQTIFVIEAEKTTEPQIKESLNIISGCPHISLLLNKTRFTASHKKFASYYGYGGR